MASFLGDSDSSTVVSCRKITYHFRNASIVPGGIQEVLQSGVQGLCIVHSQVEDPVFRWDTPIGHLGDVHEICLNDTIISAGGLYSLIRSCPNLKIMSLGVPNTSINDQICRAIGMCKDLALLELKSQRQLTARGIKAIVQGCKKLHTLNLAHTILSDNGFTALAQYVPQSLKFLDVFGGDELQEKHVAMLKENCPDIQLLKIHNLTDFGEILSNGH